MIRGTLHWPLISPILIFPTSGSGAGKLQRPRQGLHNYDYETNFMNSMWEAYKRLHPKPHRMCPSFPNLRIFKLKGNYQLPQLAKGHNCTCILPIYFFFIRFHWRACSKNMAGISETLLLERTFAFPPFRNPRPHARVSKVLWEWVTWDDLQGHPWDSKQAKDWKLENLNRNSDISSPSHGNHTQADSQIWMGAIYVIDGTNLTTSEKY